MNRNLRQLVDNCFEEAQFDAAIATLDLLRSTHHLPSPIHLLHLLFIALHPTTHPVNLQNPDEQPLNHAALLQQSPRKIVKLSRSSHLLLAPTAVQAAWRVLHAFLRTNGPTAFLHALPFYPESKSTPSTPPFNALEFVDSPIYTNVIAIYSARSVWDVLKPGFTLRAARAIPPPALAKPRTARQKLSRDASFTDSIAQLDDPTPVGEHSWLALDFLVALFEADARESSSPKHSLLLLKQLPPPPLGSQTRWDASEPLKVAFHALAEKDDRRQHIGLRLLLLLIDLTRTVYLNQPAFASAVVAHLSSFSPPSPSSSPSPSSATTPPSHSHKKRKPNSSPTQLEHHPEQQPAVNPRALDHLFALLPADTPARMLFRMTLCRKLLAGLSRRDDDDEEEEEEVEREVVHVNLGVGGADAGPTTTPNTVIGNGNGNASLANANASTSAGIGIVKQRPRPRPVLKKRKRVEEDEGEGEGEGEEKGKDQGRGTQTQMQTETGQGKGKAKAKAKAESLPTSTTPTPTPSSTAPKPTESSAPIQIQRVPVPSLGELARVLRLGLGLGLRQSQSQGFQGLGVEGGDDHALMRVRFELVLAWIGLVCSDGESGGGGGGQAGGDNGGNDGNQNQKQTQNQKRKRTLDDRTKEALGSVMDEVFGSLDGVVSEWEGDCAGGGGGGGGGEGGGRSLYYRRVLNAFVGV